MNTSSQQPSTSPVDPEAAAAAYASTLRRDVIVAMVIAALLLAGIGVGGSLASRQEPLLAQPVETSGAESPSEFVYFPSGYVNQGAASTEEVPTF